MKKKMLGIFVGLFVVAMLVLPMSGVLATKSTEVSGVFMWTGPPTWEVQRETPNGNILRGTVPLMYTGYFSGPAEGEFVWNTHDNHGVTGRNFHTIETQTGSLVILLSNSNSKWRIISGTGAFANIHGTGTFMSDTTTDMPYDFIYTGNVHYDP